VSKRGSTRAPAKAPAKARSVGTRSFARQARATGQRTGRRPPRPSRPPSERSLKLRRLLERVPRAAWLCALVAILNAVCWSILTPPFQVPDEPSHFAYTQQLAENLRLPRSSEYSFSPEEQVVMSDLHQREIQGRPEARTISSAAEQRILRGDLLQHPSRHGDGGVGGSAVDPPLYYLLETIPYGLASAGTLLAQLELMRLLSALMAGVTALFVFLFIRETLPAVPRAWTVGGLSVALAPMLGYMSGAVNPDSLLFAVSAAVFYCLARGFRRGLTPALAYTTGLLCAVGFLTKLNFAGLAPGIVLGLIVLSLRAAGALGRRAALGMLAGSLSLAASPVILYALVNLASSHPLLGIASTTLNLATRSGSVFHELSYIWQLYLPRLPGMKDYFPGLSMPRDLWFDKSVGFYGWLDTSFPAWVDNAALVPAAIVALLCVRALLVARAALRRRVAEIAVYGAVAVGLLALIGASAYYKAEESLGLAEPRYLLPLLPLLGVALALAMRGAGRRWAPACGTLIVTLFLAHDIFSQLLVVGRFYG
jgi:hypothetical protein